MTWWQMLLAWWSVGVVLHLVYLFHDIGKNESEPTLDDWGVALFGIFWRSFVWPFSIAHLEGWRRGQ